MNRYKDIEGTIGAKPGDRVALIKDTCPVQDNRGIGMKCYDLYHEDDHNNELYANVSYESDTGQWVPAEVAQRLYDQLRYAVDWYRCEMELCEEDGNENTASQWRERLALASYALSLADGDEK